MPPPFPDPGGIVQTPSPRDVDEQGQESRSEWSRGRGTVSRKKLGGVPRSSEQTITGVVSVQESGGYPASQEVRDLYVATCVTTWRAIQETS